MGAVYRPGDAKRRRRIDEALEDLDPSVRGAVKRLLENYRGEDLEKKLTELVGFERMRKLVDKR